MIIIDSTGHCKWFENSRWWGCSLYYNIYVRFTSTTNNNNRKRIFQEIKRKK